MEAINKNNLMSDFNFELFTGKKGKYNVTVSLSKPGVISFSSGMARKYGLHEYNGAQLLFDQSKKAIAIRFLKEETTGMFLLKHREENKGSYIACKSFFSAYELEKYFGKRISPIDIEYGEFGKVTVLDVSDSQAV